jgi:hypothetical protein
MPNRESVFFGPADELTILPAETAASSRRLRSAGPVGFYAALDFPPAINIDRSAELWL